MARRSRRLLARYCLQWFCGRHRRVLTHQAAPRRGGSRWSGRCGSGTVGVSGSVTAEIHEAEDGVEVVTPMRVVGHAVAAAGAAAGAQMDDGPRRMGPVRFARCVPRKFLGQNLPGSGR